LAEVEKWCRTWPDLQWGCVTGPVSNLTVIDADSPQAAAAVEALLPDPGSVVTVKTTSDGHRQFWFPCDLDIPQTQINPSLHPDRVEWIDVRNEGGFVMLPGSKAYKKDAQRNLTDEIGTYTVDRPKDKTAAQFIRERAQIPPALKAHIIKLRPLNANGTALPPVFPVVGDGDKVPRGLRDNYVFNKVLRLIDAGFPRPLIETTIEALIAGHCEPGDSPNARQKVQAGYDYRAKHPRKSPSREETPEESGETAERDIRALFRTLKQVREDAQKSPPDPIWGGLLYRGMAHLFAGLPKTGKTTLWTWLLARLTRSDTTEILGRKAAGGLSLVLISEEHDCTLVEALAEAGADEDRITVVRAGDYRALGGKRQAAARREIAIMRPDVVVLDTITKVQEVEDENSNAQMSRAIQPWADLAHKTGIALFIVHQHRKSGGEYGTEVRGGGAMESVDVYWAYERLRRGNANQRRLLVLGRRMGGGDALERDPIVLGWDGRDFVEDEIGAGVTEPGKRGLVLGAAHDLEQAGTAITAATIKTALRGQVGEATVERNLAALVREGRLEQPAIRAPYRFTEKEKRRRLSNIELILEEEEQ
jgi:hypothetical protein